MLGVVSGKTEVHEMLSGVMLIDHLELLAGVLCAHPEADLVLGSAMAMFVAKDGTVTEVRPMVFDRIDRFTMCQNCRIPIQTVLFRRSLFERYGGLIETLEAHEDWGMWLKYLEHGRRITPHAPDVRRATSLFVQPAAQSDAAARMEAYRKSDADFYNDASLCFNVTLADMRRYYDDMIDLSRLIVSDEGQMGLAFLEYLPEGRNYQYYRKNSVGSLLRASELDAEYISGAYAVHFPGMLLELTEEMRGACERLVEIAREKGILVSFDPNIRRELSADAAARARLLWAVRHADVVAPTLSEGQMITGETSIGGVLRALHAMGPRVVALTRDKDGAVLSRGGEVAVAAGIDEEPVDPTGAGDTLAAALCVGLQEDMPLARLAAFCNCAGTLVIKKKGAIGMALPERGQVDAMVASGVCRVECMPLESLV